MALLCNEANDLKKFVQRASQLANCSCQEKFFLVYVCFSRSQETDIVIKVGNAPDIGTHCKNLKL